ncbi:hypothetical protein PG994_001802 [Apiospora phragmitis]|uniref:Uncharacterized protein n=1 Tax=Apiospora phragmitis TaxID=2905665 RepID=A0ABR1WUJ7_9PEZI
MAEETLPWWMAYRSSDIELGQKVLAKHDVLVYRHDSGFVTPGPDPQQIVERLLIVLFGLLRAFKPLKHIAWFWAIVGRLWLEKRWPVRKSVT